ncbi:MAG: GNAT family N-acetyltransferase [Tidjanibacter sp.]|nr:GNAT family N-acetyltransferase [Tidjanibacter sp.]
MSTTTFSTPRLILRPWCEDDAEALFRWASNPAVGPIAGWPAHRSVEESREIIRTVFSAPETYAIVWRETDEPIGAAAIKSGEGLSPSLRGDGDAELGYWLAEPYWGRGIMTEVVEVLIDRALGELGYHRVWAGYYDGNLRSCRVMEKCGFRPHHTEYDKPTLLGDTRTEHFMVVER